jgi:DNA polymerase I-like protein with 3'-5' exonuclease and polymerase domains
MLDIAMEQGFGGSQQLPKKIVKEVTPIGRIEVFDITTTAGTFLTSSGIAHNCKDTVVTFEAALVLKELLSHLHRWPQYEFMQDVARSALVTMLRGVRINQTARSAVAGQLMAAIAEYDSLIHDIVGFPLNVGSPAQMQKFFYDDLQLPRQINRKTKRPSCDAKALATLSQKEPLIRPLVELIEKRRSLGVFLSTFCLMRLSPDGRMRCSFNVCGTETMRFSSSEDAFGNGGNLQNIPKGEEDDS